MLDPRLYRAAFVPVLLAVLVAAFSLENRPRAIGTTLAPDAFDARKAMQSLDALATEFPERRPGDAADERLASRIATELRARGPYEVGVQRFEGDTIDGERSLVNVVATRPGAEGAGILVVAHRDAAGRGARAELSGTAALLELARVVGDGRLGRTVTFVSTTGGSGGFAGAIRAAQRGGNPPDTVLVLGDVASVRRHRPLVVGWSNGPGQAPLRLTRTVDVALRGETGMAAGSPRALTQWVRLAVPVTVGEQGPFGRAGMPAVLLSASGENGPAADAPVSVARLDGFGRAALRTLYALDGAPAVRAGPTTDLVARGKVIPGWAVRLLVGALLAPALLAAVDALARARRRREPVGPWVRWTLSWAAPFAVACLFLRLLALVGLVDPAPGAPIPERGLEIGAGAVAALVASALVLVLAWIALRPRAAGMADGRPDAPGAAVAVGLVTALLAAVVWVINPYAAALLVPAAHLWLWAPMPGARLRRPAAVALALAALLPLVVVALTDARAFGLGPVQSWWFWTLLVAGGHVPVVSWLLWSVVWGCAVAALLVTSSRPDRPATEPQVTVRGPVTYAGPGSLGGTESALRR